MEQLKSRMKAIGIDLQFAPEIAGHLSGQCKSRDGARHLRRLIQSQVEGPLAEQLLKTGKKPPQMEATLKDGQIFFQIQEKI